jgi:hypothetical protein
MSNLLNFALGGLTGALSGSPLQSLTGSPLQALSGLLGNAANGQTAGGAAAGVGSRDDQMPELGSISSSINLLQQAASSQGSSTSGSSADGSSADAGQLQLPPLPAMPAPAQPAAVPTDDHGQSNIVFSDSGADGSLIR